MVHFGAGFYITGCPGQPFLSVGQSKVDLWLPFRATKFFLLYVFTFVMLGNQNFLSGNLERILVAPIGQPVFNMKPCRWRHFSTLLSREYQRLIRFLFHFQIKNEILWNHKRHSLTQICRSIYFFVEKQQCYFHVIMSGTNLT